MELFMLFLIVCFAVGLGSTPANRDRQVGIVASLVVLMTVLYYFVGQLI